MPNGLIVPILVIAVTGLMGLYAALRPEQYTRYFMAKWQRERIFGRFETLRWVGWIVFGGCVVMFLFVVLQSVRAAILAYRGGNAPFVCRCVVVVGAEPIAQAGCIY